VTPDFPPAQGGIQVLMHRLAAGLRGFDTRVVALDSPGSARFDRDSDLVVRRVRNARRLRGGRGALLNAAALGYALRFSPDITLSAHIVTSPVAAALRSALQTRTVQYFHGEEIGAKPRLAAFAARHADRAVAVSSYTAALVERAGGDPATISIIPPGVDTPNDPSPRPNDHPTFLTIARLEDRYKGHDVLVRALPLVRAKVPGAQWVVIGDGSLRLSLEQLARSYGVAESISFLGAASDERRDAWLRRANLLAMPSRLAPNGVAGEGFGIVYLEAGAYGKPVVAGNVAGALDAVVDGETGLLVDPEDPVAVADAISKLLLDRELARRLGDAGSRRAQSLAWPLICQRIEAMLHDLRR
jgi:phosphatidylinositol alpha-1,6-mannosyltransferase